MKRPTETDEATFTISGKVKITVLISLISSILGIGVLTAKVYNLEDKVQKLEELSFRNIEDHGQIITSLARIEENAKFLKENIKEIKNRGETK